MAGFPAGMSWMSAAVNITMLKDEKGVLKISVTNLFNNNGNRQVGAEPSPLSPLPGRGGMRVHIDSYTTISYINTCQTAITNTMQIMKTGDKIKQLRTSKGISQELLADNSGISLRTIQRIESGNSVPRLYTLKILAEHLNVSIEELTITDQEPIKMVYGTDEISTIRLINASGLLVIILPVINIFISLAISRTKKMNEVAVDTVKRIISFQVAWSFSCILFMMLAPVIQHLLTGSHMIGRISPVLIVYVFMLLINISFIISASKKLQKEETDIYRFVPALF